MLGTSRMHAFACRKRKARFAARAAISLLCIAIPGQALADGGAGGSGSAGTGGAGGTASTTGAGGDGGDSSVAGTNTTNGGGGGGGGAGATGGTGGQGSSPGGTGGNGGQTAGAAGSAGSTGSNQGGGGGGGGAHGYVGVAAPGSNVTGGIGGAGGAAVGGGGGGGEGGYGAVVTGSGLTGTVSTNATGGAGGAGAFGGTSSGAGSGGGGDGGVGLNFTAGGHTLTIGGSVTGGNGGITGNSPSTRTVLGGDGGTGLVTLGGTFVIDGTVLGGNGGNIANLSFGNAGAGGVGIASTGGTFIIGGSVTGGNGGAFGGGGGVVGLGGEAIRGSGLDVTVGSTGSVTAGVAGGSGGARANAIAFTGGSNNLTIESGYTITGNVVGTGSDKFTWGGSTNGTFDLGLFSTQFSGFSTRGKTGTSTWTLTNGIVTEVVDIDGGKLQFATGSLLAGNADVASGATLSFNQTGTITYGAVISGAGNFEQENAAGTVVFNTDQTYTGTTTINGTLQLGIGGTAGGISSSSDIVNNGALIVNRSNGITLGNISGNGTLTKQAAGTLTLLGDTTFSSVSVTGGGLQIGNGGATGTISGDIALSSGTSLRFNRTGTSTYAGSVSGGGSFTKLGAGTVIATGALANTGGITISAGTMQFGNGGSTGSFTGNVTNNATIDINRSGTFQYGDVMSGSGAVDVSGPGTVVFTNTNSYTGDTAITNGILSVNGQIGDGGSTTHIDGGKLGGTGTIVGTVLVNGGGRLGPGNSIGTLNVTGDVTFAPNSTLEVELSPSSSDLLQVSGLVTINGGTVVVIAPSGSYVPGTVYTIITAGSAVTGKFAALDTSLAFVTPTINYLPNSVTLTINRNATNFTDVAQTYNQYQVASALQQLQSGNPLYDSVLGQTVAGAQQAYNALSGEVYASTASVLIDQAHFVRGSIIDRLVQASYANSNGQVAALGAGGPTTVATRSEQVDDGRMALGARGGRTADASSGLRSFQDGLVFWTKAYGSWGQYDGNDNAATLDRSLGGFVSGVDTRLHGHWRAGLATGYTRSDLSVGARASSSNVDSYLLAAYAGGPVGPFLLRSGATWSWNSVEAQRNVVFPGFFETETTSYNGNVAQLFAEMAHPIQRGGMAIEPFAGLAWVHFGTSGFTETGGAAALTTNGSNDNVGYSTLGLRMASSTPLYGTTVTPRASFAWQYAFGDTTPDLSLAFAQSGVGFSVLGVPLARNSAVMEAGVDLKLSPSARLGISYVGRFAGDLQDNGIEGSLLWRF
jgi:outer membrane autotransporter protein